MQFLLLAYDYSDPEAPERRQSVRERHLEKIKELKKNGEVLFGGAILNEKGQMQGSMIVYDYPDRKSLDTLLKDEPYITGKVWDKIVIQQFRLAKID